MEPDLTYFYASIIGQLKQYIDDLANQIIIWLINLAYSVKSTLNGTEYILSYKPRWYSPFYWAWRLFLIVFLAPLGFLYIFLHTLWHSLRDPFKGATQIAKEPWEIMLAKKNLVTEQPLPPLSLDL